MTDGPTPQVTPLAGHLAERIARDGPISVADYIDVCLQHPEHGYYRRQTAIGAAADFVTAPEISQVFGELIGLWCAVVWQQMGAPASLRLIELGPGRGTLMRDALRAARLVPAFRAALRIELVETNETLEQLQREAFRNEVVPVTWSTNLTSADGPTIVIANEFLDTLPADQFVWRDGAWHRRCVGLDASGSLQFVDGPAAEANLPASLPAPAEGDIYEHRRTAFARLAADLAALGTPLAGLFIDYGHTVPNYGDTLQAILAHRYTDPLQTPGQADLTMQVDFTAFAHAIAAAGMRCDGPLPQAEFLGRLGAVERASRLMAANPARAAEIESGMARILAPTGMGGRFQVLGIRSVDVSPLPPFI
ncbi:NADH dehydrogenase [ubiquinone] 1 alpha subcomplex assembly factor 7 [Hyphomicrobium sp. 1Nfss2.1]|uniref:class I SAM-dependent methyltransferase n=1 Tax=Hyphomicrobium sp. 1Nfss2.1 TaxID=3413936 RepID=UPI003C7E1E85